jgi:putative protease
MSKTPEILAPVGDFTMCQAAVHGGADAIYVGMPGFNARGRAPTLEFSEIKKIIDYCHLYGVKVFLAFNVLIFEAEIEDAIYGIHQVAALNPDAFIVQDIGLVRLLRTIVPEIPVHASTQMTISSAEAIQMVEELGMERYVLAREVSIAEMSKIRAQTPAELEVFVHGALCVAYSGQCLTSERIGGRSANRGQCAQACRLPYKLVVDGHTKDLAGKEYLVSPRDLCGLADVPELVKLGIESFKIEGRLKSPEYVAATARAYKERSQGKLPDKDLNSRIEELAIFYSRGFFNGWLKGVNHQSLVDGFNSAHIGALIGEVKSTGQEIIVNSNAQIKLEPGQGVVFYNRLTKEKIGTQIYAVRQVKGTL